AIMRPAEQALATLGACGCITLVSPRDARHLPCAIEATKDVPPLAAISEAHETLLRALLAEPLPDAVMESAVARLIAEGNYKAEDRDAVLDGALAAVSEACDPFARALDLWSTVPGRISPIVFVVALKTLHATAVFLPKPAEVRRAIIRAHRRLR